MTDVIVETYDFSQYDPDATHVLIHVNTGKMPPQRVKVYLEKFKENFKLCKQLDRLGIEYSIVPNRNQNDQSLVGQTISVVSNPEPGCEINEPEETKTEEPWDKPYSRAMEQFLE